MFQVRNLKIYIFSSRWVTLGFDSFFRAPFRRAAAPGSAIRDAGILTLKPQVARNFSRCVRTIRYYDGNVSFACARRDGGGDYTATFRGDVRTRGRAFPPAGEVSKAEERP